MYVALLDMTENQQNYTSITKHGLAKTTGNVPSLQEYREESVQCEGWVMINISHCYNSSSPVRSKIWFLRGLSWFLFVINLCSNDLASGTESSPLLMYFLFSASPFHCLLYVKCLNFSHVHLLYIAAQDRTDDWRNLTGRHGITEGINFWWLVEKLGN